MYRRRPLVSLRPVYRRAATVQIRGAAKRVLNGFGAYCSHASLNMGAPIMPFRGQERAIKVLEEAMRDVSAPSIFLDLHIGR